MTRRGIFYYNANAGSFDRETFPTLEARAKEGGLEVREITSELDIAADIRERLARGYEIFVVGGGDGSIHHAIQALARTNGILAIVPIGTFNHLARDLGIPLDAEEALEVALRGKTHEIDVGVVSGRYFVNNMLLGLYPEIVRHRESVRRTYGKWRAYWHAMRFTMKRFPHVNIQLETEHRLEAIKTHVFAIAVNTYKTDSPGLLLPKEAFDTGVLTAYWIPYRPKWSYIPTLARYLRGRVQSGGELRRMSTRTLKVRSVLPELKAGCDGELITIPTPFDVAVVPGGLRVRAPAELRNRK